MLLLGHIGITAFIATFFYLPATFAVAGVLLPDIVDKALFLSGLSPCGRFFGHSLFFAPLLGAVTYTITRRKGFALAIMVGSFLHIAEDMTYFIPFLYPVKSYAFSSICGPMEVSLGIFEMITEGLGAALIMVTFAFNSKFLYLRDRLWFKIFKIEKVLYDKPGRTTQLLQNKKGRNKKKVGRI